ncbi:MAG: rod shape-determining protein MreC [Pyrinomonadaceae bacterium]
MIRVWAQAVASPFQWAISGAGSTGVSFFSNLANLKTAAAENSLLKERVAVLETELREAQGAVGESERLQQLLDLKKSAEYGVVSARIIARDPSAWFDSLIINRGRLAGVEVNMAVVHTGGNCWPRGGYKSGHCTGHVNYGRALLRRCRSRAAGIFKCSGHC